MRSVFVSALKAFGAVVVLLVAMEGLFYTLDEGAFHQANYIVADPVLGVRMIPDSTMQQRYLGSDEIVGIRINGDGYRGEDFPVDDTPRVAVVGDSLTFGLGVNDDETYPQRLDTLMGEHAAGLNYGVPSYGPVAKEALVSEILQGPQTRVVVFSINLGRVFAPKRPGYPGPTARDGRFVRPDIPLVHERWPLPGWLVRHSHAIDRLRAWRYGPHGNPDEIREAARARWRNLAMEATRVTQERRRLAEAGWYQLKGADGSVRAWSSIAPLIRRLKAACAEQNTSVVLLLIPTDLQFPSEWAKYGLEPEPGPPLDIVAEDLLATAEALGVPTVDVTPLLRAMPQGAFISEDWHLTPEGHDVVARALHQTLITHKMVPGEASDGPAAHREREVRQ